LIRETRRRDGERIEFDVPFLTLISQGPGFIMEAVENGLEAVNISSSRHYDIILMDCNMPLMDGWQATEKIRCVCERDSVCLFVGGVVHEEVRVYVHSVR
jgi:CheY-like chemotaxis protein